MVGPVYQAFVAQGSKKCCSLPLYRSISTRRALHRRGLTNKKATYQPQKYSPSNTSKQRPQNSGASHPAPDPMRGRKLPLILAGLTVAAIGAYLAQTFISYRRDTNQKPGLPIPDDVSDRYNTIATRFDDSVESVEKFMGLNKLRKALAQQAYGDVCEVSIGTGRNLTFYDWKFKRDDSGKRRGDQKVKSFTAVDKSAEMLEVAHDKFSKEYPGIIGVRWIIQDASLPLPGPPISANERSGNKTSKKYDTIVQTMGLCSTTDPVGLLKNLGDSLEPNGRILLLEHGKSTWRWLNKMLDTYAPRHADRYGCWWNKDIIEIVEESGLKVTKLERKHFGTTYVIELRPQTGQ